MKARQQMDLEYDALAADASAVVPGDNALKSVAHLANKMRTLERHIAGLEEALKAAKNEHRGLAEKTLPELMAEIGLAEFTMADGARVEVKNIVEAALTKEKTEQGCQWLLEHGHGGVVMNTVTVSIPKGNKELAELVTTQLRALKVPYVEERKVHPMTLKKLYREMVEQGQSLPEDLFNTFHGQKAAIKVKKGSPF